METREQPMHHNTAEKRSIQQGIGDEQSSTVARPNRRMRLITATIHNNMMTLRHGQAMARNEQELCKLRQEVPSLKRKREESGDDFQWKFKGNEKQHNFNLSVQDKFQEVAEANTLIEARAAAEEGLSLIAERKEQTY